MADKIIAGTAAVQVLEHWGVKNIYGLPGGSINSLMDALLAEKENIHYVQVRHEEVGAMAAAMHAKFTGQIGVVFGSAGPGATHLMNGLYDAREDHVPVLAIVGQVATGAMNMDTFQEMNEDPIFADVSVYHRVVMTAQQLPQVIDEAIREAYAKRGVAVVQLPVDLGWQEIDKDSLFDASKTFPKPVFAAPEATDIDAAIELLKDAEQPIIFAGVGARGAGDALVTLSKKTKAPIMISALAIDVVPHDFEAFLGSATRVARKPANDAIPRADVILMLGTNQPFIEVTNMFKSAKKVIQVDIDPSKFGKRHHTDLAILADAKEVIDALNSNLTDLPETDWWKANIDNIANWKEYTDSLENSTEEPLTLYQVYRGINNVSVENALFSVDVGDVTLTSVRHLHLKKGQQWRTSGLFATMGVGVPGAIAAKLESPEQQVWSLSGDGAFSMVMQDLATQVQEKLPIINVIFSNEQFGFIKDEQEVTNKGYIGISFTGIDFAKVADAMGAKGFTIKHPLEIDLAFKAALEEVKKGFPVVIDAKISGESPMPVEALELDPDLYTADQIAAFKTRYHAENLKPFSDFLKEEGTKTQQSSEEAHGGF